MKSDLAGKTRRPPAAIRALARAVLCAIVLCSVVLCTVAFGGAAPVTPAHAVESVPSAPDLSSAVAEARRRLEALREVAGIPGLSVAVARGDRIVWSEGLGTASLETPSPVSPATRFRAASVSKVLTIAAVARLVAEGRLDLDAPIQRYVPSFPEPETGVITPRLLAGHLAGIRHYGRKDFEDGGIDRLHFDSLADALVLFEKDPLVAPPGSEYHYSTFGFTLLGAAVAAAAGEPFLSVLDREVFRPLGMIRSGPDDPGAVLAGRTQHYDRSAQGLRRSPPIDPSYKWPGGGLLTTPEDLVRLGSAHLRDGFVPVSVRQMLFTSQKTADGKETGVGLGWRIGTDRQGRRVFHHAGSMSGTRSVLLLFPDQDVSAALMTNLEGTPALIEQTLELVVEPLLESLDASPGPPFATTPLAGTYRYQGEVSGEGVAPARISGTLVLERSPDHGLRGWMSTPEWLSGVLRANGLPDRATLPVLAATVDDDGVSLILATAFGLHPLASHPIENGFSTEIGVGSTRMTLEAERLSPGGDVAARR